MDNLKNSFTSFIHDIIDNTGMPYHKGFDMFILKNALSKNNTKLREDIFDKRLYQVQNLINAFNLQEATNIIKFSNASNIKIVFMKGLFLASKLYDDVNLRMATDIDLLVDETDLCKIYNFFIANNYKYSGDADLIAESRKHHLKFSKMIGEIFDILVEVHSNANNPPSLNRKFSNLAYACARTENLLGLMPTIFSDIDQVIHLLLHFSRHSMNLKGYSAFNYSIQAVSLKDLYDVCLLICRRNIAYEKLDERIDQTETQTGVYYGLKCINEIIPGFIPQRIINKCRNAVKIDLNNEINPLNNENKQLVPLLTEKFKKSICTSIIKKPIWLLTDYSNLLVLNIKRQQLFHFNNGDFICFVDAFVDKNFLKFDFCFSKRKDDNYAFVAHYRIAKSTEKALFQKIKISFLRDKDVWRVEISKPWENIILNNFIVCVIEKDVLINLIIKMPLKYFIPNKIVTYSINFVGGIDLCVTGKSWNDFDSMQHFKIGTSC